MNSVALLSSGGSLQWVKPSFLRRRYELMVSGSTGGEIAFHGICGSRATASIGNKQWTIERRGFFARTVIVHGGSGGPAATFSPRWHGGGPVILDDGTQLQWTSTGFFRQMWQFVDQKGEPFLTFRNCGPLQQRTDVQFSGALAEERVALLAALGCYLMVLQQEDAAAAMIGATAAS